MYNSNEESKINETKVETCAFCKIELYTLNTSAREPDICIYCQETLDVKMSIYS